MAEHALRKLRAWTNRSSSRQTMHDVGMRSGAGGSAAVVRENSTGPLELRGSTGPWAVSVSNLAVIVPSTTR